MVNPHYIQLHESGRLKEKVDTAMSYLEECKVCPWNCDVNRLNDEKKVCRIGRYARVASYFPHFGEEDCLRGQNGSGTIFFGWCNLRCVFCQNFDISQRDAGTEVRPKQLAKMMIELQERGCHNINWVTPEHIVPQILESLPYAIEMGLHLPIVYNTSAFDSKKSLELMKGIVDIYMPDFKYWSRKKSKKYLKTELYPESARNSISEMHRQVGDLVISQDGIAKKGLLVRHLVMPGSLDDSRKILYFLAKEISSNTYVNIMGQYRPAGKVNANKYQELNIPIAEYEVREVIQIARASGLFRIDSQY